MNWGHSCDKIYIQIFYSSINNRLIVLLENLASLFYGGGGGGGERGTKE